jgi:hypothetical protein
VTAPRIHTPSFATLLRAHVFIRARQGNELEVFTKEYVNRIGLLLYRVGFDIVTKFKE